MLLVGLKSSSSGIRTASASVTRRNEQDCCPKFWIFQHSVQCIGMNNKEYIDSLTGTELRRIVLKGLTETERCIIFLEGEESYSKVTEMALDRLIELTLEREHNSRELAVWGEYDSSFA